MTEYLYAYKINDYTLVDHAHGGRGSISTDKVVIYADKIDEFYFDQVGVDAYLGKIPIIEDIE